MPVIAKHFDPDFQRDVYHCLAVEMLTLQQAADKLNSNQNSVRQAAKLYTSTRPTQKRILANVRAEARKRKAELSSIPPTIDDTLAMARQRVAGDYLYQQWRAA